MFGPRVFRHPNGPLRPTLGMRLRRRLLRSRRAAIAALSLYVAASLGFIVWLVHLSLG